ncbi:MAG: efflux RND transporter periplasmic adaptor subunit [Hyphomicrobiaceae bacterium]
MTTLLKRLIALLVAASAVGVVYYASTKGTNQVAQGQKGQKGGAGKSASGNGEGNAPTPVLVEAARLADVPVTLEGVGSVKALNTVTVKAQIEGKITKIAFKEGQQVKKGDVLVEIDDTTFRAARDQAAAKRQLTATQLENAKRDLTRYNSVASGVIAQKTVDTQRAQVAQLDAQLKADDAAIASTEAVLNYAVVRAPIDGRTGLRQVDEGNIVRGSDALGLVVITQLQPLAILFTLPQQQLSQVVSAQNRTPVAVEALDSDNKRVLDRGSLLVYDNQIDPQTGTVRMKAEFPNANLQLWPGQFVNVRLLVDTLKNVVVVPTPAIQRGPNGAFVFVMNGPDKVAMKTVTVAQQTDTLSVVTAGLASGDQVVTTGFGRLQDGARVFVSPPDTPRAPGTAGTTAPTVSNDQRARFARIREACATELQTHCASTPRDQIRQCLETNKSKFGAPCQATIDAVAASTTNAPNISDTTAKKADTDKTVERRKRREGADAAATPSAIAPTGTVR